MLNLDETFDLLEDYNTQRDLIFRSFLYSIGVIIIVEMLRSQLPEVDFIQLIPGFYLVFLFSTFLFLLSISTIFFTLPYKIDSDKGFGTRIPAKVNIFISLNLGVLLCLFTFYLSTLTTIPLSLDSFNSYGEKTLENIWSFDEVIGLESFLGFILVILSQIPIFALTVLKSQKDLTNLQKFWRAISLGTFILAGMATPTIDGYTHLSFSGFGLSFYGLIIILLYRRIIIRFNGSMTLGF
jgi:hypothetical protein